MLTSFPGWLWCTSALGLGQYLLTLTWSSSSPLILNLGSTLQSLGNLFKNTDHWAPVWKSDLPVLLWDWGIHIFLKLLRDFLVHLGFRNLLLFSCSVVSNSFRPHGLQHAWVSDAIQPSHPLDWEILFPIISLNSVTWEQMKGTLNFFKTGELPTRWT